jgi:hypothetical protein
MFLQIDFINFKVVDKKDCKANRGTGRPMIPLRTYKPLGEIGKTTEQNVFLLDQFTIADDKMLIEILRRTGGRHQTLR